MGGFLVSGCLLEGEGQDEGSRLKDTHFAVCSAFVEEVFVLIPRSLCRGSTHDGDRMSGAGV